MNHAQTNPTPVRGQSPVAAEPPFRSAHLLELGLVILIVAIAGWLRIARLDLMEFKMDEALAVDLTLPLVEGRFVPAIGLLSSVGVHNPATLMHVLAPVIFMNPDPVAVTTAIAVAATLAVLATYFVLRRRFGAFSAVCAASLFASGPWAVILGRKIWAPDVLPVFTVLLLWSLFLVTERARSWAVAAIPVLLSVIAQLHFSGVALLPVAGTVLLVRRRSLRWGALAIGVVVGLLCAAPFLRHQWSTGWAEFRSFEEFGRARAVQPWAHALPIVYSANLTGARGWTLVTGVSEPEFASESGAIRDLTAAASLLMPLLLVSGVLVLSVRLVRRLRSVSFRPGALSDDDLRRAVLVVWLVGVWATFGAARLAAVHWHYFVVTYPVSFAVVAVFIDDLRRIAIVERTRATAITSAAVAGVCLTFVAFNLAFYRFVERHGGTGGDYGIAFRHKDAAVLFALEHGLKLRTEAPEFEMLESLRRRYPPAGRTAVDPADADSAIVSSLSSAGSVLVVSDGLRQPLSCPPESTVSFGPLHGCLQPTP